MTKSRMNWETPLKSKFGLSLQHPISQMAINTLWFILSMDNVLGYDNAEGKGHHRHSGTLEEAYKFISLKKLSTDFIKDIKNYKRRFYEDKKS